MTVIFISYARDTRPVTSKVAIGLEKDGYRVWWDDDFRGGDFIGAQIEDQIMAATRVLVTWSAAARRSIWVHGEALQALDSGKLVQVCLDRNRPPVPFNALHFIDFSSWNGTRNDIVWKNLRDSLSKPDRNTSEHGEPVTFSGVSAVRMAIGLSPIATLLSFIGPLGSAIAVGLLQTGHLTGDGFRMAADLTLLVSLCAVGAAIAQFLRFKVWSPK